MDKGTLIFAGSRFYPLGGMKDLYSYGKDVASGISFIESSKLDYDWYQIVDAKTLKILCEGTAENIYSNEGKWLEIKYDWMNILDEK